MRGWACRNSVTIQSQHFNKAGNHGGSSQHSQQRKMGFNRILYGSRKLEEDMHWIVENIGARFAVGALRKGISVA